MNENLVLSLSLILPPISNSPTISLLFIIFRISHTLDWRCDILVSEPTVLDDVSAMAVEVNCVVGSEIGSKDGRRNET